MLSVTAALENILGDFSVLSSESVPLLKSHNRVLAEDIRAPFEFPLFTNASMDGFAVQSEDLRTATPDHPVELVVAGDVPAGTAEQQILQPGQAIRIMTGAPVPAGCDAVVPVEDTNLKIQTEGVLPKTVKIFHTIQKGENLRPRGQDFYEGELLLTAGTLLRSQEIGFLGMLGKKVVSVVRIPHIALLSTGDELIEIGSPLEPGKIYDANSYLLSTQIYESGGDCLYLGVARDNYESIYQCLERAYSRRVDLIVSSAGVSVGAFDLVRKVLEENGQISFWRVKMRPGKPLAFGKYHDIPFIGLPGNPVSAFVGFEIFIRPAIQKMRGMNPYLRPVSKVKILEPIVSDGRESYLRGLVIQRENGLFAKLVGHQGSGNIRSLIQSNAFLIVPSEVKSLPIGAEVNAWITGAIQEG